MAKHKTDTKPAPKQQMVARNRRASFDYEIIDELDCGVVLLGSEVKSIRNGKIVIEEGYARLQNNELWLLNVDIAEYPQANFMNHERRRDRKLLLKRRELHKFAEAGSEKGLTMIPTAVFFERGLVKVRIAIGRGRKSHDKRDKIRTKDDAREMRDAKRVRV